MIRGPWLESLFSPAVAFSGGGRVLDESKCPPFQDGSCKPASVHGTCTQRAAHVVCSVRGYFNE